MNNKCTALCQWQEKEIINLYQSGVSTRELGKKYDVDKGTIKRVLLRNDIQMRTLSEANMLYHLDDNIFSEIDSHDKAYWLGFLTADGNVFNNTIKIGLAIKDIDHLYRFKRFLKYDGKVHTGFSTLNGNKYPSCEISFRSKQIKQDISLHGIVARKSHTIQFSKLIPDKFASSYVLGIFDGDGCFNVMKLDKTKLHLTVEQLRFSLLATNDVNNNIAGIFHDKLNIKEKEAQAYKKSKTISLLQYGGNNILKKISNYFYDNATTFLPRKKKIVLNHFHSMINNQNNTC